MAYPADSAPKTELLIDGTWTDVSSRVRGDSTIAITRGRADEQSRVTAQRSNFTLNNRDGLFSNRNPLSAYFGKLPRNTQVRHTAGAVAETYVQMQTRTDNSGSKMTTPDVAALDITGDIEVRVDVEPDTWRPEQRVIFMSKDNATGSQRSWVFYMNTNGLLRFFWSPDGTTGSSLFVESTASIPATSGRLALRVTFDVNDGSGGHTINFYTSTGGIDGTWTQLGATWSGAGVQSIFSGSARVVCGGGDALDGSLSSSMGFGGKFYKARIYNGIGGTVVANPNFTALALTATSHTDSTGKVWTLQNDVRVASERVRFVGELTTLPQMWDKTKADVWVPVQASGPIRRLTQGAKSLQSAMYRNFSQYSPTGYWPMEDGSTSTAAASAVPGAPAAVTRNMSFGQTSAGLPGSAGYAAFSQATSSFVGTARGAANGTATSFIVYVNLNALPASGSVGFINVYGNGLVKRIDICLSALNWTFNCYAADGTLLGSPGAGVSTVNPTERWMGVNISLVQNGGNVDFYARWDKTTPGDSGVGIGPTSLGAGTVGRFTSWRALGSGDVVYQNLRLAQVFMTNSDLNLSRSTFRDASTAYYGENAITRARRLASEEAVPLEAWGAAANSQAMGYQRVATFMELMYEVADADGGLLAECRDRVALSYRSRRSLLSRYGVTLTESLGHLTEIPSAPEDDAGVVNDVTVMTPTGASARTQVTTGDLGSNTIGVYESTPTLNIVEDDLLEASGWIAEVGTWSGLRIPTLAVSLHRKPFTSSAALTLATASTDLGATITLNGLPTWMPPDDVLLLVQGYTERMSKFLWDIVFNTTSAGPYALATWDSDAPKVRFSAETSFLKSSITSTATSLVIATPTTSQGWAPSATYPGSYPYAIKIGGEVMTLTALTAGSVVSGNLEQTATVTRSVNGIVKAQTAGTLVDLATVNYIAR